MATRGPLVVRGAMPDQHRALFQQLAYLFLGAVDSRGRPWATMAIGQPGFITSPDSSVLRIAASLADDDPVASSLTPEAQIGILGLELHTRRRNRANGIVEAATPDALTVRIRQSFGNCPRYIQTRQPFAAPIGRSAAATRDRHFTQEMRTLIETSDTFFIASRSASLDSESAANGVDVSHRGGRPGFVDVVDSGRLRFPDYRGNQFFNTLGNLVSDSSAGLLFIDFDTGSILQLTGRAEIVWTPPDATRFPGAQRLLHYSLDEAIWRVHALSLTFMPIDPHCP